MTDNSALLIGILFLVALALAFWVGRLSAQKSSPRVIIPEFPSDGPLAAPREQPEDNRPVLRRSAPPPPAGAGPLGNGEGGFASGGATVSAPGKAGSRGKPPPAAAG